MAEPLWTSDEIVAATGGRLAGAPFAATGVSIDTRTLEPGDLFVALADVRDGHDFVPAALECGAAGALVGREVGGAGVVVPDTLAALGEAGLGGARAVLSAHGAARSPARSARPASPRRSARGWSAPARRIAR